jgi:hypothetical protein
MSPTPITDLTQSPTTSPLAATNSMEEDNNLLSSLYSDANSHNMATDHGEPDLTSQPTVPEYTIQREDIDSHAIDTEIPDSATAAAAEEEQQQSSHSYQTSLSTHNAERLLENDHRSESQTQLYNDPPTYQRKDEHEWNLRMDTSDHPSAESQDESHAASKREEKTEERYGQSIVSRNEVIELSDTDSEDDNDNKAKADDVAHQKEHLETSEMKRLAQSSLLHHNRQTPSRFALANYEGGLARMPGDRRDREKPVTAARGTPIQVGQTLGASFERHSTAPPQSTSSSGDANDAATAARAPYASLADNAISPSTTMLNHALPVPMKEEPVYINWPPGFTPTWEQMIPSLIKPPPPVGSGRKYYQLSLLNVNEFTIVGLPVGHADGPVTPVAGLRKVIKQIARDHGGTATFQRDKEETSEGRWRIPLSAYQTFYAYLRSDPQVRVGGIPEYQLKIASLERARQEKGYPSEEYLVQLGVPRGLSRALAPFQRGGVDFVLEKDGKALIADGTY